MKLNSTLALTFSLLTIMLGAGTVSAFWGFKLGHEALQGVTQPDANPSKKLTGTSENSNQSKSVTFVAEKQVIAQVKQRIEAKSNNSQAEKAQPKAETPKQAEEEKPSASPTTDTQENVTSANFPLKGQDGGVTLEVVKATQQGGSLLLDVNLKNESSQAVQFLYSFLDVRDERGRTLSAITDGLPEDIPANGEVFAGTVKIPGALLDEAQKISLTLTDYPEQKLQLKVPEIPVVR